MLSVHVPHDMPVWHHQLSFVMLWWSASSPSAPVAGSMVAQLGKKISVCVSKCLRMKVFIVSRAHVGRLEISKDVKGHFGECPSVCVTEVAGMDERERK